MEPFQSRLIAQTVRGERCLSWGFILYILRGTFVVCGAAHSPFWLRQVMGVSMWSNSKTISKAPICSSTKASVLSFTAPASCRYLYGSPSWSPIHFSTRTRTVGCRLQRGAFVQTQVCVLALHSWAAAALVYWRSSQERVSAGSVTSGISGWHGWLIFVPDTRITGKRSFRRMRQAV